MLCSYQYKNDTCQAIIPNDQLLCKFHQSVQSRLNARKPMYNWIKTFKPDLEQSKLNYKIISKSKAKTARISYEEEGDLSLDVVDFGTGFYRDVYHNFIVRYNNGRLEVVGVFRDNRILELNNEEKEVAQNLELLF